MRSSILSRPLPAVLCAGLLVAAAPAAATDLWPEYRGPFANGHACARGLPRDLAAQENRVWTTPVHGKAWSTPVLWGDRIWLTTATADGKEMYVLALDRSSGRVLLDRRLFENESPRELGNPLNTYASPSPVVEPGRLYAHFGSYGTACLDTATSEVIWSRRDLPCDHFRGPASSPVLFDGLVILHMDGSDHQYVVALDKESGETAWRTPRSVDYDDLDEDGKPVADGDFRKAFNTPIVVGFEGRPLLISPAAKAAYGYDPRTGEELWKVRYEQHSTASRTVYADGVAYINTGYPRAQLLAVRVDGRGDVTDTHVLWRRRRQIPRKPSPVLVDGLLFLMSDNGIATCVDAATGETVWVERVGGEYSASPILADGLVWFFSHEGKVTALRPSRELEVVARSRIDDGLLACPVAIGDAFYLRTRSELLCLEDRGATTGREDTSAEAEDPSPAAGGGR